MGGGAGGGGFKGTKGSKPRRQHGSTPMNNKVQNEQTRSVARKLNLTETEREQLHDLVHDQGWDYQKILEYARMYFGKY